MHGSLFMHTESFVHDVAVRSALSRVAEVQAFNVLVVAVARTLTPVANSATADASRTTDKFIHASMAHGIVVRTPGKSADGQANHGQGNAQKQSDKKPMAKGLDGRGGILKKLLVP